MVSNGGKKMKQYKGFCYKKVNCGDYEYYQLYNEKGEDECQCFDLNELKDIVDTRLELGYWAY